MLYGYFYHHHNSITPCYMEKNHYHSSFLKPCNFVTIITNTLRELIK